MGRATRSSHSAKTGICHCDAEQATKAGAGIHRLSLADQGQAGVVREPEKEPKP